MHVFQQKQKKNQQQGSLRKETSACIATELEKLAASSVCIIVDIEKHAFILPQKQRDEYISLQKQRNESNYKSRRTSVSLQKVKVL